MIAETRSYIFRWRSRFCHRVCLSSLFVATGVNCWCHLFLHNLEQSQKLTCFLWDGLLLLRSVSLVASMVVLLVVHGSHCFSSSYLSGDMMWRFQKNFKKWNGFIVLQWRDLFTSRISWYYLLIFYFYHTCNILHQR